MELRISQHHEQHHDRTFEEADRFTVELRLLLTGAEQQLLATYRLLDEVVGPDKETVYFLIGNLLFIRRADVYEALSARDRVKENIDILVRRATAMATFPTVEPISVTYELPELPA